MLLGEGQIKSGPHLYSGESGRRILWTYVGALWLVVVVSAAFFGWSSLVVLAGAVGTCVAVDLAMCRLAGSRNPASLPHAVLTGLLLGLTLPMMVELETMLQRHPNLPVVLDHCMFPRGNDGIQGETIQKALHLARYPNLHAKLTWLVAGSDQPHPFADTHPLIKAVIDAYGPDRCVWGSDFPCEYYTPQVTYDQHLALFSQTLNLSGAEQEAILSTVPGRLWFGE